MADREAREHLRALERMGVRVVARPPELLLERLALLVALADAPNLLAELGIPRIAASAILDTEQAKTARAEVGAWLAEIGQELPEPAKVLAQLETWRDTLRGARRDPMPIVPIPRPQLCRSPGCERRAATTPRRQSLTERYVPPDGYCLEHAREGRDEQERMRAWVVPVPVVRAWHLADGAGTPEQLIASQAFYPDGALRPREVREPICGRPETGTGRIYHACTLPVGHDGDHEYESLE